MNGENHLPYIIKFSLPSYKINFIQDQKDSSIFSNLALYKICFKVGINISSSKKKFENYVTEYAH